MSMFSTVSSLVDCLLNKCSQFILTDYNLSNDNVQSALNVDLHGGEHVPV